MVYIYVLMCFFRVKHQTYATDIHLAYRRSLPLNNRQCLRRYKDERFCHGFAPAPTQCYIFLKKKKKVESTICTIKTLKHCHLSKNRKHLTNTFKQKNKTPFGCLAH